MSQPLLPSGAAARRLPATLPVWCQLDEVAESHGPALIDLGASLDAAVVNPTLFLTYPSAFLPAEPGTQAAAAGGTVNTMEAGVRVANARTLASRAAAENAQLQLDYTHITAPASGEISRKQVEVGQLVSPGQPLLSIVADTGVWITGNFKETQLATIRPGQPVEFEIDAYNKCVGQGTVASVSGATGAKFALLPPDNATGNFTKVVQRVPVRIAVTKPCPGYTLRPGLSANVHIDTSKR